MPATLLLTAYLSSCPPCWQNFVRSMNQSGRDYSEIHRHLEDYLKSNYNILYYIDNMYTEFYVIKNNESEPIYNAVVFATQEDLTHFVLTWS